MSKMLDEYLPEKEFLKQFALESYHRKYKHTLDPEKCRIKSIRHAYGLKYGYQIETARTDDHVVILLYFNLGPVTRSDIVRVELIQNLDLPGMIGDEAYVVTGEIAQFYRDNNIYRFKWIQDDGYDENAAVYMDDTPILFANGDYMTWMSNQPAPPYPPIQGPVADA